MVSEIADYEVHRSLLRAGNTRGVEKLDTLCDELGVLGLDGPTMRLAAQLWAQARRGGYQTASDARLDADVILAAQARMVGQDPGVPVVIAMENARHLGWFVDARAWDAIWGKKGDIAIIYNCR